MTTENKKNDRAYSYFDEPMTDCIRVYYDPDIRPLKYAFIGSEDEMRATYMDAEYACIYEDNDEWMYKNFYEWKHSVICEGWVQMEFADLSTKEELNPWYFFTETRELKSITDVYMMWQKNRDVNNPFDTFAEFLDMPTKDRNATQFYGFYTRFEMM